MNEGQPLPQPLENRELEISASQLIRTFTQNSQIPELLRHPEPLVGEPKELVDSVGFYRNGYYFSAGHDVYNGSERLRVLRYPQNGGYGEDHLYVETPVTPGAGEATIELKVYHRGRDYQPEPDSELKDSEALPGASRVVSSVSLPIAA